MVGPSVPSSAATPEQRAIVIGGSIAGLLAARVLAETFAEVLVIERDPLPQKAAPRKGTPHAVHPHGLLAQGGLAMETLFPGFSGALLAQGAAAGDIGTAVAVEVNGRRFAPVALGLGGIGATRFAIEGELRRRVRGLPAVSFVPNTSVLSPIQESGRILGVRTQAADGSSEPSLCHAAFVIDCSGRGSRAPAWLREWGYGAPEEETVEIDLAYTSAYFRREVLRTPDVRAVIGTATPQQPKPYVLLAQEPDEEGTARWVVGLGGYAGDHVEVSIDGMRRRAREIGSAEISALVETGEMLGAPISYRFPHNLRRRYERLREFPHGFLVMGDALASFNPIYGQGMTVAACEALALRDLMARGTQRLAPRFFKAAAKIIDVPWQLAVGGDLALPQVPGPRPFPVRLVNAYVARVMQAATGDAQVAAAFVRVMHLLEPPASLFYLSVAWRVLVHRGGRRAAVPAQASVIPG